MRKIFDREGNPITLGPVVGRGGEAVAYSMPGYPSRIAKIYEPAPHPNYPAKLAWMLNNPPVDPTAALGHPSLAWPAALLYDQDRHLAGYMMPYIKEAAPILVVFNPRRRSEVLPQFDRQYLHRTACNLATAIGALHQGNYVVGDLNESNILVKSSALVSLIDTDSFQVQAPNGGRTITYACPVAKPEYTPPELQGKHLSSIVRTSEQDAFGLGVLIFQLLMEGNHPFRAQWLGKGDPPPLEERIATGGFPYTSTPGLPVRPPKYAPDIDLLHPALTELFRRCFIDGNRSPSQRPGAADWARAIAKAEKSLVPCPNGHVYSNHLQACPVCHAGRVTSRGSAKSTTGRYPAGSRAQDERKTTGGNRQTTTAYSSRSGSTNASAPSASPHASSSTASNTVPPHGANSSQASSGQSSANASSGKRRPSGGAFAGNPSGPAAGPNINATFRKTQHAWKTFKYWQSQTQQTSTPYGNQAQQVRAAWSAWKYWQAGPVQGAGPTTQPASSGTAKGQTAPGNTGNAQSNRTTTNTAGAGSTHQAQQSSANSSRAQQTRSAPFYTGPNQSRNTSSGLGANPGMSGTSLLNWAGPRLYKSLAIGGGLGALVGALSGALIGIAGWLTAGNMMSWVLLWAIGGASAGLLRGWLPGYRVSLWVDQSVGWQRVLPVVGVLIGAGLGGVMGFALCWWAILPVFIGLFFGGRMGLKAGNKLWLFGSQYGWERIWACIAALFTGLLGWRLALWFGAGSLSTQLAGSFSTWITGQSVSLDMMALTFGALGGALGGAVAGTLADLFARIFNLLD